MTNSQDWVKWVTRGANKAAIKESVSTQLPGRINGLADAFRHTMLSAELVRKDGHLAANRILLAHEFQGEIEDLYNVPRDYNIFKMDIHNNSVGEAIGEYVFQQGGDFRDIIKITREYYSAFFGCYINRYTK